MRCPLNMPGTAVSPSFVLIFPLPGMLIRVLSLWSVLTCIQGQYMGHCLQKAFFHHSRLPWEGIPASSGFPSWPSNMFTYHTGFEFIALLLFALHFICRIDSSIILGGHPRKACQMDAWDGWGGLGSGMGSWCKIWISQLFFWFDKHCYDLFSFSKSHWLPASG